MKKKFETLMKLVSEMEGIQSIGKTGLPSLPESIESDVDIFIFCNKIQNNR